MNVLGVELELDFYDADQLEIYERENKKVADTINEPTQYDGKSTADAIRIQCRILDNFFDKVFGAGTAQRIFKGKNNIKDHMEAFGIVANAAMEANAEFDAMADKYSPNRAERRAEQKRQGQNVQNFQSFQGHAHGNGKGKGSYNGKNKNRGNQ